jgi:hypothetical protein
VRSFPFRACAGNVLLLKVAMDAHQSGLIIYGGGSPSVLQVGEIVGLGGRWSQDRPWFPPMPTPHRTPLDNGKWDDSWKPPDMTDRARAKPALFDAAHAAWLDELSVGDLIVYVQSRVYDHFEWEGRDVLVYPGNWVYGAITGTSLNANPHLRRYEGEQFDDAPHHKAKNPHGP